MVTKWFLYLSKNVETVKEKIISLTNDNIFLMSLNTFLGIFALSFFIPLLVFFYALALNKHELALNVKMTVLEKKVNKLALLKNTHDKFVREFGSCDIHFLQNSLETLSFLKDEALLFSKIAMKTDYKPVQNRLEFLSTPANKMIFLKDTSRKSDCYEETEWKLEHQVEVSLSDINQVLSLIEGVRLDRFLPNYSRPQLVIKKLSLKTKNEGEKIFSLDLELLQRNLYEKG